MRLRFGLFTFGVCGLLGCSASSSLSVRPESKIPVVPSVPQPTSSDLVQVAHTDAAPTKDTAVATVDPPKTLADFTAMTLTHHPRLAQVGWAVEAARGRAIQAGLYPNPTIAITGDEISDRTGPNGIWSAPQVNQEIVTGNKLGLAQAVAGKEVDQATLALMTERFRLLTDVRKSYWDVVALRRRAEVLTELIAIADQSIVLVNRLLLAKEASELDLVPLEVDGERYRAELEATRRSLPAAFRKLASTVGRPELPESALASNLSDEMPKYDLEAIKAFVIAEHPEVRSSLVGVERARLAIRRAEAEPIPNVTISSGYIRQNQNKSNDWMIGASVPLPVWNKNQGNIIAAKAQLGEAMNDVGRVQSDLSAKLSTSYTAYAAAKARADAFRTAILPKAERNLELSRKAFQNGVFDSLKVLQAQRAVGEARLEQVKAQSEMWQAGSELAGFMLDETWPVAPRTRSETDTP